MATKLNFVSCILWIQQGVAKEFPERFQLTQEEIHNKIKHDRLRYKELKRSVADDQPMETDGTTNQQNTNNDGNEDSDIINRYNLDDYDDDDENDDFLIPDTTATDPYLDREQNYSDEEEEKDDFRIKPTDNLLLAGHVEEDSVSLEVKIYNTEDDIYCHHEIYLSAYPLCFQWLNYNNKNINMTGNFVAIGDMENDINIWNLDVVDILDPHSILRGHKKSVLDLSWSEKYPNILASGSADKKCIIWDLQNETIKQQFNEFKSSVQSLSFHPIEANILLTGDSNGNAKLLNYNSKSVKNQNVCKDEIEKVLWNSQQPYTYLCGTSKGWLYCFDCRNDNGKNIFAIKAHSDMISGMEFTSANNGCLITASADQTIKIWSISPETSLEAENKPKLLQTIEPNVGTILSLSTNPNHSNIFAVSGDYVGENLKIIDMLKYENLKQFC